MTGNLNDPYSQGLPERPQPGPEEASSPNDLNNLYDQDLARSSLKPLRLRDRSPVSSAHLLGRNDMFPKLSVSGILLPCAPGIVSHQETFPNHPVLKCLGINP